MWRQVPGFPDYEASTDGLIRSLERTIKQSNGSLRTFPSKVLKPGKNRRNYFIVSLIAPDRSHNTRSVHRLILETFVGPRPEGLECRHLDGNHQNNNLINLCWGTPGDNMADKIAHGTYVRGEKVGNSVLTEAHVCSIYMKAHTGAQMDALAKEYGVSRQSIEAIKYQRNWKWLTDQI
jgi:hypothetical protein